MKKIFFSILLFCLYFNFFSQITTTVNPTIAQITQKLSGNGVTITGLTKTCPTDAYALYSGGNGILSTLSSGILLTTGSAIDVSPSSTSLDTDNLSAGSALGDALDLSGNGTKDACYIKFLITPSCHTLSVNYVFASSEYSDYVNASYNDVFGFVLDGPNPSGGNYNQTNIALVPGTNLPVSINNVNNGVGFAALGIPPTGPCMNCAYFQDAPAGIGYTGSTTVLTASTAVTPCQTYTMTIGVWDVFDGAIDSGVFLDVNGLSCVNSPTITSTMSSSLLCTPQTITLTASGAAATGSYSWTSSSSGGLTATTGSLVTANPTATSTYSLLYTDVNTCPGVPIINTSTLTFTSTPSFSVTQTPASAICAGQTITLTANGGSGTYSWTPNTFLSSTTSSIVVASPTVTTNYSVTKTTTLGCTSTTVVTVNVNSSPTIAITPSNTIICIGQNVPLSSSGTGPFTWTASNGVNPPSAANVTVSPITSTSYTVLSGTGTCTSIATASITVSTNSSISITPSSPTVCPNQIISLSSGGTGPFVWTDSNGSNLASTASITVAPMANTTYTVLSGSGTCTSSATASITVLPTIIPSISISNSVVCLTNTISISTSSVAGLSYTWQPISSIQGNNNTDSIIAQPTSTASVIYTLQASNGICISTNTIQLNVLTPVNTNFTTTTNDTICTNGCVTFYATSSGSKPITNQWFFEGGSPATITGDSLKSCYPTAGNYSVTLISTNACGIDTLIKLNDITVYDIPNLMISNDTTIKIGDSGYLSATGALSYYWYPNTDGTIACAFCSGTAVSPTITTQYVVIASNSSYCTTRDTVIVNVDVNCGDFFVPNAFSPNDDGLNDAINVHGRCISTFRLIIFDRWGEKVFETTSLSNSWDGTFRGQKMDTGVFIYKVDGVSILGQEFKLKGNITLLR